MKRIHLERGTDLLRALMIIQEDSSEKEKQERMVRRIKGKQVNEKDDEPADEEATDDEPADEEATDDEPADDEAADDEPAADKPKDKKKDGKLPGTKRLEDAELKQGQQPTAKDIIQRINFVRAGASLKDEKVKKDIDMWISQLKTPERLAVYTTLDALAKIVLARKSAAEAPTFSSPGNLEITGGEDKTPTSTTMGPKKASSPATKTQSAGPVPITVGEGVVRKLREIDVPVKSGKVVPFGSKAHVADLQGRIEDLERIRSYQERGSETRHSLGLAIKALKSQLGGALKRSPSGNPRTQAVPPIVEKGK